MIVSSTEIQNNFGRYLMLAAAEDIIITKNGKEIAKLCSINPKFLMSSNDVVMVEEEAPEYMGDYGGKKATYEEFLELVTKSEKRYEYIDGEIYCLSSPKTVHQIAVAEIFVSFYNFFQGKKCSPMVAPYDITLKRNQKNINVVQPDIMVICDLEEKLNEKDYYMGVPSLIVEVISESTRAKDFVKKLDLYMSCGVKEYWIVNPLNKEVAVYAFRDCDIYANITFRQSETAKSYIFEGLTIDLSRIFLSFFTAK